MTQLFLFPKYKMEIWIIYRRIGTYIVPDIWDVVIPEPLQYSEQFQWVQK